MIRILETQLKRLLPGLISLVALTLSGCGGGGGHAGIPSEQASGTSQLRYGNTLFSVGVFSTQAVAVGALGTILTSPDGITWTRGAPESPSTQWRRRLRTTAVAVGDVGAIVSSTDLTSWYSEVGDDESAARRRLDWHPVRRGGDAGLS